MRHLPITLMVFGGLMVLGPLVWLTAHWLRLKWNETAYQDTYFVVVAPNWPVILYLGSSMTLITLGFWLRQRARKG